MVKNKKGNDQEHPNIIIKKKLYEGEGGHHGGTWKIAYADFMTAMMTFFLVMWLINSSSKEKITQLASYFNPVKLNDRAPSAKKVGDNQKSGNDEETLASGKPDKKPDKPATNPANAQKQAEEETLFKNPFGVLTQLASQAEGAMAAAMPEGNSDTHATGGLSRDPYVTDPINSQPLTRITPRSEREEPRPAAEAPLAKSELKPDEEEKRASPKAQPTLAGEHINRETQQTASQLEKELSREI